MLRGERKLEISHHDSSSTSRSDCNSESTVNSETEKLGPHHFMVHSLIGRGAFGEVYLVERKDTGKFFAMKVLDKDKIMSKYSLKIGMFLTRIRAQFDQLRQNGEKRPFDYEPSIHREFDHSLPDRIEAVPHSRVLSWRRPR